MWSQKEKSRKESQAPSPVPVPTLVQAQPFLCLNSTASAPWQCSACVLWPHPDNTLSVCALASSQRALWNPTEFGRTPLEFLHKTCLIRENLHQMKSTYNGVAKALTSRGERTGIQLKSSRDGFHLGGPDLESEIHRQMYDLLSSLWKYRNITCRVCNGGTESYYGSCDFYKEYKYGRS